MSKKRNWFGANTYIGGCFGISGLCIGGVAITLFSCLIPKPIMAQNIVLYGGGGGGGGGINNGVGGAGSGGYAGTNIIPNKGRGEDGTGTLAGNGGQGGVMGINPVVEQDISNIFGNAITVYTLKAETDGLKLGSGGKAGDVRIYANDDVTIESLILEAGNGGDPGTLARYGASENKGGNGGTVEFTAAHGDVTINKELILESGFNSKLANEDVNHSRGGATVFVGERLIIGNNLANNTPVSIKLIKNDGSLIFHSESLDARQASADINIQGTIALDTATGLGVTFGDLLIGLGQSVNISGEGLYTINSLTVGDYSQTNLNAPATFSSHEDLTFDTTRTMTFYLPGNLKNGAVLLINNGNNINLNDGTVKIYMSNGQMLSQLKYGDSIYLISNNVTGTIHQNSSSQTILDYGAKEWAFNVAVKEDNLIATLIENGKDPSNPDGGGTVIQDKANSYFQSNAATINALNHASNQVAAMDDYVLPLKPKAIGKVIEGVALLQHSGYGQRVETGSHVKLNGMNLLAGIGIRYYQDHSKLLATAFVEHGLSDFDTYTDSSQGYGNIDYTGGGIYGKQTWDNGWFVDASWRMGNVKNNYMSISLIDGAFDDVKRMYYGWHIGLGKDIFLSPIDKTILIGKILSTSMDDFSTTTKAGENLYFVKAHSLRSYLGARYEREVSETTTIYTSLAWEHEWDGKTGGTLDNIKINSPDLSGASAVFELGGKIEDIPYMPSWTANAAIRGVTGKSEEVAGKIGIGYRW